MTQCKTWDEFINRLTAYIQHRLQHKGSWIGYSFTKLGKKELVEILVNKQSRNVTLLHGRLTMSIYFHSIYGPTAQLSGGDDDNYLLCVPMIEVQRVHMQFELEKKL